MVRPVVALGGPPPTVPAHDGNRWQPNGPVRYMLKPLPIDFGIDPDQVATIVDDCFQDWQAAGRLPFAFQKVANGDCEITIAWLQNPGPQTDGYVASAEFPPNTPGTPNQIVFDAAQPWTVSGTANTYDLPTLVRHEIGHAIGLGHSFSGGLVMSGSIGMGRAISLTQPDIDAAVKLYNPTLLQRVALSLKSLFSSAARGIACGALPPATVPPP